MAPSELETAADTSFAQLHKQLGKPPRLIGDKPVNNRRYRLMATAGFGLAASILLLLHSSPPLQEGASDNLNYRTLSIRRPENTGDTLLKVVFAPNLPGNIVDDLLAKVHGRKIGLANSVGAYTIKLEAQGGITVDQALALLRNHGGVILAEPVQQP